MHCPTVETRWGFLARHPTRHHGNMDGEHRMALEHNTMTHVESGLSYSGLKSFMESNGWELVDEDYEYSVFGGKMSPHTNMQVLTNLLTLAGYSCFNPTTWTVPNRIYVIHRD